MKAKGVAGRRWDGMKENEVEVRRWDGERVAGSLIEGGMDEEERGR